MYRFTASILALSALAGCGSLSPQGDLAAASRYERTAAAGFPAPRDPAEAAYVAESQRAAAAERIDESQYGAYAEPAETYSHPPRSRRAGAMSSQNTRVSRTQSTSRGVDIDRGRSPRGSQEWLKEEQDATRRAEERIRREPGICREC